jgi:hypothetical protein
MNKKLIDQLEGVKKELNERKDAIGLERNASFTIETAIALLTEADAERAKVVSAAPDSALRTPHSALK